MDIETRFFDFTRGADHVLSGFRLAEDDGLTTAVIVSLFTDRRALPDDVLPDGRLGREGDPRGWWGDGVADVDGDRIGSRLWLLAREKQLDSVVARAREYAAEALAWLVDDGVASAVDVDAFIPRDGVLGLRCTITRPRAPAAAFAFESFWRGA